MKQKYAILITKVGYIQFDPKPKHTGCLKSNGMNSGILKICGPPGWQSQPGTQDFGMNLQVCMD